MNQKGIFKRKFFSVVVFYQVQWLHVFGEVFRQESSHQSEKVIVQAMMDLFNGLPFVQVVVRFNYL